MLWKLLFIVFFSHQNNCKAVRLFPNEESLRIELRDNYDAKVVYTIGQRGMHAVSTSTTKCEKSVLCLVMKRFEKYFEKVARWDISS